MYVWVCLNFVNTIKKTTRKINKLKKVYSNFVYKKKI